MKVKIIKNKIIWNPEYDTDIESINNQHKMMIDLANDLIRAVDAKANMRVVDALFEVLRNFCFNHFSEEEKHLVDREDFLEHCYQHYQLLRQFNDFTLAFRNNRAENLEPGEFLADWLTDHLVKFDLPALRTQKELVLTLEQEENTTQEVKVEKVGEKRQHPRISSARLVDEGITGICNNATKQKTCSFVVDDLSSGGMKISCKEHFDIDDLLVVNCRIGKLFHLKEKAVVRYARHGEYGIAFLNPQEATKTFLVQLYGSVHHNKYQWSK